MFSPEPLLNNQTPFFRLLILLLIILISTLFTMLLGILVLVPFYGTDILEKLSVAVSMADPNQIDMMKFMQVVNQVGIFIIPALFYAYLQNRKISQFLKFDKKPLLLSVMMTGILVFTFLPFTHWLANVNQNMSLPEFLGVVERWMKESEEAAENLTRAFLKTDSLWGLLSNILIVGVLASVGEELLFRSVLINLFRSWFKNVHLAVIVSALLFSAFHLQFYGFLPRFMLGMLFGYLFVWSGNLWLPIIAHFINNASAVVVYYMFNTGSIAIEAEEFGSTDNWGALVLSTIVSIALLAGIYIFEKGRVVDGQKANTSESN